MSTTESVTPVVDPHATVPAAPRQPTPEESMDPTHRVLKPLPGRFGVIPSGTLVCGDAYRNRDALIKTGYLVPLDADERANLKKTRADALKADDDRKNRQK